LYNKTVHQLFIEFKRVYDSVRREVFYSILIEFGVPMKLVRLIKMCLNETYSKICIGKHLPDKVSCAEWFKTRRCFIAIAFQLCFRICHEEGPERPGGTEMKWDASAADLHW
jgi:hypothetical protein